VPENQFGNYWASTLTLLRFTVPDLKALNKNLMRSTSMGGAMTLRFETVSSSPSHNDLDE
jgi:hypothetical protein